MLTENTESNKTNNGNTIEDSISRLISDINCGTPLTINGKKYCFTGFYTTKSPQHAKEFYETLRKFFNNEKALFTFNQSSALISEYTNIRCKINELLKKYDTTKPIIHTQTGLLTRNTRELINLFLEAQKIDIKKEIEKVKKIIKANFNTKLTNEQNNKTENNDQLYTYIVFLANITGKSVETWLNFIKNYKTQIFDEPTTHVVNKTINNVFKHTNEQFIKKFEFTTTDMEKNIIIHKNMIVLEAKTIRCRLNITTIDPKNDQQLDVPCDITIKYEQKDGENLTLKKSCVKSKMIKQLVSNTENIKSEAIYINNLSSINTELENSLNNYKQHWYNKSKFTQNWHNFFNFLTKKITTRKNNKKTIKKTIEIINNAIKKAMQEISKGNKTNNKNKNKTTTEICLQLSKLRGKFIHRTYDKVESLLKKITPRENNKPSSATINQKLKFTEPNLNKISKVKKRIKTNKTTHNNTVKPLYTLLFKQIEKSAITMVTKIRSCFSRPSQ
ncbi:MAG: hypothetical protein PVI75_05030 [Gammaproteobacteria bacterium]|jgi:hypothetical protein